MYRSAANPEAGDVHVPADDQLADAVEHAVLLTWRHNPYYRLRFGERGLRFSLSDSGWMATLPDHGVSGARQQLTWLHRVLANRGMPGWLLEDHLGMMQRVLDRRVPHRRDDWAVFGTVRGELADARRAVLPDAELNARAEAFARAAGAPGHRLFVGAGRLLAGAWADQEQGMPKAIETMLSWVANRDHLPESWCDRCEEAVGY